MEDNTEENYVDDGEVQTSTSKKNVSAEKSARVRFDNDDDNSDDASEKDTRTKYKELAKKIAAGERLHQDIDDVEDVETNLPTMEMNIRTLKKL